VQPEASAASVTAAPRHLTAAQLERHISAAPGGDRLRRVGRICKLHTWGEL
jgi:hypothetical protein